jgi:hypothetical protein
MPPAHHMANDGRSVRVPSSSARHRVRCLHLSNHERINQTVMYGHNPSGCLLWK